MKFETKYKFCKLKAYFDCGYVLTGYFKYLIAVFGLASRDVSKTLIIGGIYGVLCFLIGYLWYRFGWVTASAEVSNQYNLFVKEMRKKRKI